MGRKLAIGLVIIVVIGAGLALSGGRVHLKLGEHHAGIGKHIGHHGRRGGMERTINVSGTGAVVTLPDRVHISVGVRSFGKEAADALDVNNTKMTRVVEGLLALGLDRNDIQTSEFSLDRRTNREQVSLENPEGFIGYDIKNKIRIKTAKVELVGTVLDSVIGWGATNIDSLYFSVSNQSELISEARSLAVEDAKVTAADLAEAAGVTLGPILLINEATSQRYRETSAAMEVERLDAEMPIYMTQERVATGVTVTFAIK